MIPDGNFAAFCIYAVGTYKFFNILLFYFHFPAHKLLISNRLAGHISGSGCDREASVEEKKILSTHSLMLENRQNGRITGVKDIKSFDEKEILLFTQAGKLVIKGEQLHVKQLDLEKGEVDLEGKVDSLTYLSKNTDNRDESLFRRMFR